MGVFRSHYSDVEIPDIGIYHFVTSNPNNIPDSKVVFVDATTHRKITFGEFKRDSKRFAAGLQDQLEFKRGDVLCIYSPNQVDYATVIYGTLVAGGRISPANPSYTVKELTHQLIDSGSSVIITHPDYLSNAIEAAVNTKIPESRIFVFGENRINGIHPYTTLFGAREAVPVEYTAQEVRTTTAYLCYSSGTTGKNKGVETTHYNMVANVSQIIGFEGDNLCADLCYIGVLPFYHMYALNINLHLALVLGATSVVIPRFDIATFCRAIQDYKVDIAPVVPPIVLSLVKSSVAREYDLSSLKHIICGAAPLSKSLSDDFDRIYNIPIQQVYGLTEISPVSHLGPLKKLLNGMHNYWFSIYDTSLMKSLFSNLFGQTGSVGVLLPNIEAKVLSEDGEELGHNEPGELYVRGPMLMKGYLNNNQATNWVIDKDGWFRTGDIASVDPDGYYFIIDRVKELIKYKGFQVAPAELEALLLTHSSVADAAVISIYSEKDATELPVAYIVPQQGHEPTAELKDGIEQFVATKAAPHKKIRGGIVFVDQIPKSASGKILR
ncbi:13669_t:CDS:10, partial [Acaulospora colombiana]